MFVSDFKEIDLTKKVDVITDNEKFISAITKLLFNRDFNLLGNILNIIDDMGDEIILSKINNLDLQFSCKNIHGDEYTVYLFDDDRGDKRFFLVFNSKGDMNFYILSFNRGKIFFKNMFNDKANEGNFGRKRIISE